MRYAPAAQLRQGMETAFPIYGNDFQVLIGAGTPLSQAAIRRIGELGYPGVYIEDQRWSEIKIRDIIPPTLRISTMRTAKEFLDLAARGVTSRAPMQVTKERQRQVIMPLIQALIDADPRLIDMLDLKPSANYDCYHAASVVVLSLLVGIEMGLSGTQLYELGMAALLHDVGNVFVSAVILKKPSGLSPEEYRQVQSHSAKGFDYLRENFDISIEAAMGAQQHHEHYDGTGYPNRLRGERINIFGRIIAVADVYDALVSQRPFRGPLAPADALDMITAQAGTKFDPAIVETLCRVVARYPSGVLVELDSGARCMVVSNSRENPARPRLRLADHLSRTPLYMDLQSDPAYQVTGIQCTVSA